MSKKKLIIHIDDIGMSYAANQAAMRLFQKGIATSGSIMVPCAWAYDFVQWHRDNQYFDIGIHLTTHCEWDTARWSPLTSIQESPDLVDLDGFMPKEVNELFFRVSPVQILGELSTQIKTLNKWNVQPSHMDNHMFSLVLNDLLFEEYLKLAQQYNLMPLIPKWSIWNEERSKLVEKFNYPSIQTIDLDTTTNDYYERKMSLLHRIEEIKVGVNLITLHPVIETEEIKSVIPNWKSRVIDYQLFMDDEIKEALISAQIELISWKDIHKTNFNLGRN